MNQESLQQLFSEIKNSPSETTINDVSEWLHGTSVVAPQSGSTAFSLTTKIISMISILAIAITGGIYFMGDDNSAEKKTTPPPIENKSISIPSQQPASVNPKQKVNVLIRPAVQPLVNDSAPVQTIIPSEKRSVDPEETKQIDKGIQSDQPIVNIVADKQLNDDGSGVWKSSKDSLHIDTVFNGVKKIVFKGEVNNKITVTGSRRNNVSMSYVYLYKAKGIFVGKSRCEVSFEKVDSVLMIQVKRNATVYMGVSISKLNSSVTFDIPENIAVDINTSYGDIDINNIRDNDFYFKTLYGDIKAQHIEGNTVMKTNYGDIELSHIHGKILSETSYGDINGVMITGSESVEFKSGYGDINCQLTNPVTDCSLKLKTYYGKIKVKRKDLEIESDKKLSFGSGGVEVSATTSYGDVIIK